MKKSLRSVHFFEVYYQVNRNFFFKLTDLKNIYNNLNNWKRCLL